MLASEWMLTRLHVRGYKALRDVQVAFEPMTVIVGPNGCGKTSVLDAISLVRDSAVVGKDAVKDRLVEELRSKRTEPSFVIAELWATDTADQDLHEAQASMVWETYEPPSIYGSLRVAVEQPHVFRPIRRLGFDIEALARPSYLPETEPRMKDDGVGIATVLSWLQGERDDRFAAIEQRLREFVPEVRRIRTRRVPIRTVESADVKVGQDDDGNDVYEKRSYQREEIGHQVVIDYEHAEGVPAPHASEGTLLLLGLLTAIHTSGASVLLLDDIERGLHPKSQQQLVGYLREMTSQGTQIIATSHSPYLLLHLEYEQVRAMTLDGAAGSRIGKLSEHPQFEQWKEEMTPSEFWTVFGEEWLRGRTGRG